MKPAAAVVLLDLVLLALLLAVVVLKMQNTRPDRASPTGRSRNGRATPIPTIQHQFPIRAQENRYE